jgi:transposase
METIYPRCAGLDVHKRTVVACVRRVEPTGRAREWVQTFGTMTGELLALSDWLAEHGVTHVAMESTGVFWKPIFNILEGRCEVLLVNPQHIKQVPGARPTSPIASGSPSCSSTACCGAVSCRRSPSVSCAT